MYTLLHIARIIIFVTLFLEATTHNVSEQFLPNKDTIYSENPIFIDKPPPKIKPTGFTRIYNRFIARPIYITICFGSFFMVFCFYFYCLLKWYLSVRQRHRALMEIISEFLIYICLPRVERVWRRIMELIRPPANDDNRDAVRYREGNINPSARETDDIYFFENQDY